MEAALASRGVQVTAEGREFLKGAFKSILGQILASTTVSGAQLAPSGPEKHNHKQLVQVTVQG